MYWSTAGGARQARIAAQRQSLQAAAQGSPIPLREATLGARVPGGAAYGAQLGGQPVLVQRGAAGSGALAAGGINFGGQTLYPARSGADVVWMPARRSAPAPLEQRGERVSAGSPPAAAAAPVLAPAAVLSDDRDARASERRRMQQQYAPQNYWASETGQAMAAAVAAGPRAGEAGYAQRPDIAAWIAAHQDGPRGADGKNMVERFLERQRAQGLLEAPGGAVAGPGGERLQMPTDAESAAQAAMTYRNAAEPATAPAQTLLQVAQADLAAQLEQEQAALAAAALRSPALGQRYGSGIDPELASALQPAPALDPALAYGAEFQGGLALARRPMEAEAVRQQALAPVAQANPAQALATGTGAGSPAVQPESAMASQLGVEPGQGEAPGNKPNPADELLRRHKEQLRSRAALFEQQGALR